MTNKTRVAAKAEPKGEVLAERFEKLLTGYDHLEQLFKVSQLALLDFRTSVLNEHRYFARALVDYCKATSEREKLKSLGRAEVALSAAYNDIVDFLVNQIKSVVSELYETHWNSRVKEVLNLYGYKDVIGAIEAAHKLIGETRRERSNRFDQYVKLVQTPDFKKLIDFALSLLTIEYECSADGKSGRAQVRRQIAALRTALSDSGDVTQPRFELFFQPKFRWEPASKSTRLIGAEALIRLNYPDLGILPPSDFLNVAHRAHLTDGIGNWVVDEAIKIATEWRKSGILPSEFDLSVNITPDQMASDGFADEFRTKVITHGVDDVISIELIEDWLHDDRQHVDVAYRLGELSDKTRVAIDDFGAGSTRIEYIANIDKLHALKIDKSLVDGILTKNRKRAVSLIRGIVQLAESNSLEVLAEGVEKQEQLECLVGLGVHLFQGYAPTLGMPAPRSAFETRHLSLRPKRSR